VKPLPVPPPTRQRTRACFSFPDARGGTEPSRTHAALHGIRQGNRLGGRSAVSHPPRGSAGACLRSAAKAAASSVVRRDFYWVRARRGGTFCSRPLGCLLLLRFHARPRVLPSRPSWAPRSILRVRLPLSLPVAPFCLPGCSALWTLEPFSLSSANVIIFFIDVASTLPNDE
jgi:hypothetical protein